MECKNKTKEKNNAQPSPPQKSQNQPNKKKTPKQTKLNKTPKLPNPQTPQVSQYITHMYRRQYIVKFLASICLWGEQKERHLVRGRKLILYPTTRAKINLTTFRQP